MNDKFSELVRIRLIAQFQTFLMYFNETVVSTFPISLTPLLAVDFDLILNYSESLISGQDEINLLVYGSDQPYFKPKKKITLQNFDQLAFFNLLFSIF